MDVKYVIVFKIREANLIPGWNLHEALPALDRITNDEKIRMIAPIWQK